MKLDIVRAWKDERYRQALSADQLRALPANPVGELTDAEMEMVYGGGGGLGSGGGGGGGPVTPATPVIHHGPSWHQSHHVVGVTTSAATSSTHCHSWVVAICDLNVFSNDIAIAALQNVLNIGSPRNETCAFAG